MNRLPIASALFCSLLLSAANAQEWPGFRGPNHDGVAPTGKPPTAWSDSENLVWKRELPGPGSASPIVIGDRIYVACYTGYGAYLDDGGAPNKLKHHLVCVDRKTGEILFDKTVAGAREKQAPRMQLSEHGFASPTPATDGKRIFAYFGTAGVVAFDLDGEQLWQSTTGTVRTDSKTPTNQVVRNGKALKLRWGTAASPVLYEDLVIVNASEQSNTIRAYKQNDGELAWSYESPNLEGCATTPMIAGTGSERVLVMCLGGEVWGLNPRTGKLEWRVETGTRGGMSPTPVADGKVVYTFGGLGKSFALKLGSVDEKPVSTPPPAKTDGETTAVPDSPRILWQGANLDIPSPALYDGKLFLVRTNGTASCLDVKNGEEIFDGRLEGRTSSVYASPVIANGHVYVVSRKRGTFVYSADGQFTLISRNELDDDDQFNASPAMAGDSIFLRSDKFLYRISNADGRPDPDS